MKCILSMLLFFSLFGLFAYGQSGGGTLPFGTADVHEYDSVDLATLVPTINIPVVAKQGAIPFSLTLTAPQICNLEPLNGWGGTRGWTVTKIVYLPRMYRARSAHWRAAFMKPAWYAAARLRGLIPTITSFFTHPMERLDIHSLQPSLCQHALLKVSPLTQLITLGIC